MYQEEIEAWQEESFDAYLIKKDEIRNSIVEFLISSFCIDFITVQYLE